MSREGTVRNDKPFDLRAMMCCCNQNQLEALHTFRGHEHTPGCNSTRGRSANSPLLPPRCWLASAQRNVHLKADDARRPQPEARDSLQR